MRRDGAISPSEPYTKWSGRSQYIFAKVTDSLGMFWVTLEGGGEKSTHNVNSTTTSYRSLEERVKERKVQEISVCN